MANINTINTRILLKYDTYTNWTTNNPVLKAGEMAIATIASGNTQEVNSVTAPQVLIKVGDGTSNYNALPFVSAKAADVYDWAKAATKPTYEAKDITGIDAYIANYVEEQMGISVDTDTQYQIVKVDDYNYKLQSKGKTDSAWADVEGSAIVIPNDTAAIEALQGLVGNEAVATQIANAIAALDLANTYEAKGEAAKVQTKLDEEIERAKKVESENAAAAKAADDKAAAAQTAVDTLSGKVGEVPADKTVVQMISEAQTAATYDDTQVKADIKANTDAIATLNDGAEVEGSVDYKIAQAVAAIMENPDDTMNSINELVTWINGHAEDALELSNKVSANEEDIAALEGLVGEKAVATQITEAIAAALQVEGVDKYALATDLTAAIGRIAAMEAKVANWDAAEQNAKDYADGLNTQMNSRVEALEAIDHEHANKEELDKIAVGDKAKWDAKQDALEIDGEVSAENKVATQSTVSGAVEAAVADLDSEIVATEGSVLTGVTITDGKLTAKTEVALATIATTGNVNDLVQDEGDYIIFDCGSSTKNI